MRAITNHRSCLLSSHPTTLIRLPFSCSVLLVPHRCCSAFWIAVARFSLCILHRSTLGYVAVTSFDPQLDIVASTAESPLTQTGYSHHTISTLPDSAPHWRAHSDIRLQQRSVACPTGSSKPPRCLSHTRLRNYLRSATRSLNQLCRLTDSLMRM
jgi:hypothetical protein